MFALLPDFVDDGGLAAIVVVAFLGVLLVQFLIQLVICWLVYNAALTVPPEHREIEPALAFLLLVPCLGLFLNFLIQPAVARSFKRWFAARGVTTEGDCGESLAWWHAITSVCALVPCVPFVGLTAIVLQIIYLLRLSRVRSTARAMVPAA
jgi:hypothetical protein